MTDFEVKLNPEPTDIQWAQFKRHKAAGTSPGNPKWYKPQIVKPFEFKAGLPARLPRIETGAEWLAKHGSSRATMGQAAIIKYKDGSTRAIWGK